jgi:hypothetical protein
MIKYHTDRIKRWRKMPLTFLFDLNTSSLMSADTSIWGQHQFADAKELSLDWERFRVRLLKRGNDLLLVENRGENEGGFQLGSDPEANFRRYAFENPVQTIRVQPITPDRPLVVQPLHPLRLAPMAKVDFYVSIPVDIQISTVDAVSDEPLERLRSEILSDTWFGDQVGGVLCYAMKSRARRECPTIDSMQNTRAICKIRIQNKSTEQLHCKKFCLRLDHCNLWQSGTALWTSPVSIRFNGSDHLSAIDYSPEAPKEASNAIKIAEAIEEPLSGIIRRTFAGLGSSLT